MNLNNYQHTPIQKLNENFNNNSFYMKRDDLFPISFGGNKAKKAILFFEDIKEKGSDVVVTYGSSSSNHCRVIANIAASKNIPCYIISPSESSHTTVNSKMTELFGASIEMCPVSEVSKTIEEKIYTLKKEGRNPYFIQGGGHGNIGTQAYVNAYKEILKYENENGVYFDYIFHTSGTGTTQAGLICGQVLNGDERKIVGVSNARKNPQGNNVVIDSVNSYLKSINKEVEATKHVRFTDDYILEGYGSYNDEIIQTIRDVLIKDGIPLDPIYTGKSYWGMKKYIKKNQITHKKILFIHTGGTPLFFDKLGELEHER